jgi:hypothetical protein
MCRYNPVAHANVPLGTILFNPDESSYLLIALNCYYTYRNISTNTRSHTKIFRILLDIIVLFGSVKNNVLN